MKKEQLEKILGGNVNINMFIFEKGKESHVRVKSSSKKIKKFFNRNFGTGNKVTKALLSNGLKEGLNTLSMNDFLSVIDEINEKSLEMLTMKMVKAQKIKNLEGIDWSSLPKKNKSMRGKIRRYLMKKNHKFIKKAGWTSPIEVDFDTLPVLGFKEKEVIKYFDLQ